MITDKPLLMKGPLVVNTLAGMKTETRRVMTPQPIVHFNDSIEWHNKKLNCGYCHTRRAAFEKLALGVCPYGQVGDLLWVRETFRMDSRATDLARVCYKASERGSHTEFHEMVTVDRIGNAQPSMRWKPAIHMPRWASRLTLEILDVGVERIKEITNESAAAEGILIKVERGLRGNPPDDYISPFIMLWDSINASRGFSWNMNPWVWRIKYRAHKMNIDDFLRTKK